MGNQTTGLHLLQPNKQPRETFVPTLNERETEGGKKAASASVHIHLNAEADSRTPQVSGGTRRERQWALSAVRDHLESFLNPSGCLQPCRSQALGHPGVTHCPLSPPPTRPGTGLTPNPQRRRGWDRASQLPGGGTPRGLQSATLWFSSLEDPTWAERWRPPQGLR